MQNAELDHEVALILHLHASGPLDEEIDDMQLLLDSFVAHGASGVAE